MQHLVILFLHVASAMGIVASFGIESLVLVQLRAARSADARSVLASYRYARRSSPASTSRPCTGAGAAHGWASRFSPLSRSPSSAR